MKSAVEVLSRTSAEFYRAPVDTGGHQVTTKRTWRGVKIGAYNILLDPSIQGEIQEDLVIQPVPRSRQFCQGLANLRGNLVAIFDLRDFFEEEAVAQRWYLILHSDPAWVGFTMDALPEQLAIGEEERLEQLPPLPSGLQDFVIAGYRAQDNLWLEVNYTQLFKHLSEQAISPAA